MKNGIYATFVRTKNGRIYDLGKREYPPRHEPGCACGCLIANAWTALRETTEQAGKLIITGRPAGEEL